MVRWLEIGEGGNENATTSVARLQSQRDCAPKPRVGSRSGATLGTRFFTPSTPTGVVKSLLHVMALQIDTVGCALAAAMGSLALAATSATIISTFDSDLESWTEDSEGSISHTGTGGNPDGYLECSAVGASSDLDAPAAFLGDLSAYDGGTFSWDGLAIDEGSGSVPGSYAYGKVTVTGTAGSATSALIPSANRPTIASGWSSYSHDFTATAFGKTEGEWDAILAGVTSISLGCNAYGGFEDLGYDNIALNAVPEPSTTALLGLGGLALILRRRK